jgi:hypothetical protein
MRLSYRGAHYSYQPTPVDLVDSGIVGQYRGRRHAVDYPRHIPVPQPTAVLQYRGVPYQTTETGSICPVARVERGDRAVAMPLPPQTKIHQQQISEANKIHRETIRQRLQHRIDVAKAKGDTVLLHELERELHLFA